MTNSLCLEDWIYETQIEKWIEFLKIVEENDKNSYSTCNICNYGYGIQTCDCDYWKPFSRFVKWETIQQSWIIKSSTKVDDETIPEYSSIKWCCYDVSCNSNITWDIIQRNPKFNWVSAGVSKNPNITWDIVKNNPDFPWQYNCIAMYNTTITYDIIKNEIKRLYSHFGRNPIIKCEDIENVQSDKAWNWMDFSYNPNLTWEYLLSNMDKCWNWEVIMNREFITPERFDYITQKYFVKPKDIIPIIIHSIKTLRSYFSSNPNITIEYIQSTGIKKWDWRRLSANPSMMPEIIKNNTEYPWVWNKVAINPGLTWKFILDNIDKGWFWCRFYKNPFTHQLDLIKQECIRKWYAAKKIRRWWLFKVYFNPFTSVGSKRLLKSYQEMVNDVE